jgi:hypothetical protein
MSEEAEEVRRNFDPENLTEKQWLARICRELVTQRQLLSELVRFNRDAEKEIPEYMRRFANYMHDLHDIAYMYSEVGQEPPVWIKEEMKRCDDRCRQLLKREHTDGTFASVRAEMAGDEDNKWDHTKALTFKESKS